ncbi:DHA2 family efflux MFS transporter permease subunit [Asticcacaulis sp. EMRT-3]|uniref:DHA2 family efflux MFS transporter permease subunit n=1 Tax=Asticcacaulis sp. EMRT-3 TaxID=3040349 RepID=UPI0024AEFE47|nr:DHA2 family efflux MFS transporter permease subunit [Asticcacaulis sp. EMRT-3]MDI7773935.1 DHA2 family efflux MFS transporter permease subunit [Asticcacaulis sp. EMRT-3]
MSSATATAAPSAGPAPLTGTALGVTAIALALGTFMQVLDSTIANVSIPTIAGNLGVSTSQGTWVITSFAVANGISVPLTGWLMGRYGVVKVFLASVVMFTIASFLCGVAWNIDSLIMFRILQGAVSGPMIPGSQALLLMIFPPNKRGTALAIWSMTTLVAPICGPILGGYISDNISWPWIFFINLPVGAICTFLCWQGLQGRETPTFRRQIDRTGFMLLIVWVGALQIMLDTGKDADWFNSPVIVVETLVAVVGFLAWVIWELNDKQPIVDLSLFKTRNFALGCVVLCIGYAIFFGNNLLMPLWLQTQVGYQAFWAGMVAAPSGMVAVFLTPFAARMLNKYDARIMATVSMIFFSLSFYMRSLYTPDASFVTYAIPMAVMGVAMSTFFISMIAIVLNGVPGQQMPAASGLSNFARIVAGSFAASLATTIWDRFESNHQTRLAEIMGGAGGTSQPVAEAMHQASGLGLSQAQGAGMIVHQVVGQAYLGAALDFFRVSGIIVLLLIPLIWMCGETRASGPVHAAAD